MLTHPNGEMMATKALEGMGCYDRLIVALREEHLVTMPLPNIRRAFEDSPVQAELIVVGNTDSHVETVCRALIRCGVRGTFTARDCDSYFLYDCPPPEMCGNYVAVANILKTEGFVVPSGKGYVQTDGSKVVRMSDDQMLSPVFLAGAYTFHSAKRFLELAGIPTEGIVPHIKPNVSRMSDVFQNFIDEGGVCKTKEVMEYIDWNTKEAWKAYCETFQTLFVDIDGVLLVNEFGSWENATILKKNFETLSKLASTGRTTIVLTTARPESMREATKRQLSGLTYHHLIMGLPNARRILVNDFVPHRGNFTADAVNLARNSDELETALKRVNVYAE